MTQKQAQPTQQLTLPDGGRLAYAITGTGAPIVLVRPVGGSLLSWGRFAQRLAEQLRVIAFDARGTGASSPARLPTTTRAMARDLVALLDHLGLAQSAVYGLSLGGMVASWLAIDAPTRVGRLVLASTLARGLEVNAGAARRAFALARCLMRSPAEAEACLATRILSRGFRDARPDAVQTIQAAARLRPASHRGLLTLLAAAAAHDVRARLHEVRAETLILLGELDPLLTLESQRELYRELPHTTFHVIPQAGHDISVEAPELVASRVLGFVQRA